MSHGGSQSPVAYDRQYLTAALLRARLSADSPVGRKSIAYADLTTAEAAAGLVLADITPSWPEGWVPRYGALGAGADETTLVQRALTVGMQGVTVRFPKNKTYLVGQMNVKAGMRILGEGATSVLKLLASSTSFRRMLTTEANLHDQTYDSEVLEIDGLSFDGNRLNQGTYTGFEKEHQAPIFLTGQNTKAGRLRARVSNCFFRDTCGDGIGIYYNTDTVVENCFFEDCFRSSVAATGGYAKLRIYGCRGVGATHTSRFQIEIDGAGFGAVKTMELLMSDCDWAGGLDMAADGGSTVYVANTYFRSDSECILNMDGSSTGLKSTSVYTNCFFRIGSNSSNSHRFLHYGLCRFEGCTFEWTNNITHTDFIQVGGSTDQVLTFQGCHFRGDATYHTAATVTIATASWAAGLLTIDTSAVHGLAVNDYIEVASVTTDVNGIYRINSVVDTDTVTVPFPRDPGAVTVGSGTLRKRSTLNAMSSSADTFTTRNQINVFGCHFDASIDCAFDMKQGGCLTMRDNHVAGGLLYDAGSAATFFFDVRIGQYTTGPKHRQMCHIIGSVAGCTLRHENTYVPVDRSGFTRTSNLTGMTIMGSRVIYGSGAALTSDPGLAGDRYRKSPPVALSQQQYCCVVSGQSGASTTWAVETQLV
jgi:hypothetical protein